MKFTTIKTKAINRNFFRKKVHAPIFNSTYFQLNLNESEHVIRVGLLSPYTQFTNIARSTSDSGLKGQSEENDRSDSNNGSPHNDQSSYQNNDNGQGQHGSQSRTLSRNGNGHGYGQENGNGQSGHSQNGGTNQNLQNGGEHGHGHQPSRQGNQPYQTPLQNAAFSKYKGIEYSYLYHEK
jgi:hypothetical protein